MHRRLVMPYIRYGQHRNDPIEKENRALIGCHQSDIDRIREVLLHTGAHHPHIVEHGCVAYLSESYVHAFRVEILARISARYAFLSQIILLVVLDLIGHRVCYRDGDDIGAPDEVDVAF